MNEVSLVQRQLFPADLPVSSTEALRRSEDARQELSWLIDQDAGVRMERQAFVIRAGRLMAEATWPYMRPVANEYASLYVDGPRVPRMQMKRPVPTGTVSVTLVQADSRLLAEATGSDGRVSLVAGLSYQETPDFLRAGSHFVKDNRQGLGEFYDTAHENPEAMAPPLMDLARLVLKSLEN